jgi:hypothetical protein
VVTAEALGSLRVVRRRVKTVAEAGGRVVMGESQGGRGKVDDEDEDEDEVVV